MTFVLLSPRRGDGVLAAEYDDFLRFTGLSADELEQRPLDHKDADYGDFTGVTGIFIGGSPFTLTEENIDGVEPDWQQAVTAKLVHLIRTAAGLPSDGVDAENLDYGEADLKNIPVFSVCYGSAMMAAALGGHVTQRYGESAGKTEIHKTLAGENDLLTGSLPQRFDALTGHKDSVEKLPEEAIHLLEGPSCPVQLYRLGEHVWISQFHPEMDSLAIARRVSHYGKNGYYDPADKSAVFDRFAGVNTAVANSLLRRFVAISRDRVPVAVLR